MDEDDVSLGLGLVATAAQQCGQWGQGLEAGTQLCHQHQGSGMRASPTALRFPNQTQYGYTDCCGAAAVAACELLRRRERDDAALLRSLNEPVRRRWGTRCEPLGRAPLLSRRQAGSIL